MTQAIGIDTQALTAAGFKSVSYPGQDGVFFRRDTRIETMPYLGTVQDGEFIIGSCIACTEVYPEDGRVHIMVSETAYTEEAVLASSEEGQGLLRDAIAGTYAGKDLEKVSCAVPADLVASLTQELNNNTLRYMLAMYWQGRVDKLPTHLLPLLAWATFNCIPDVYAPRENVSYQFKPGVMMFRGMDHAFVLDLVGQNAAKALGS